MNCCFQIQKIKLPKQFLFDSIRFYAQFQSAAVQLLTLGFDLSLSAQQRNVPLNIQLKIPSIRSKFTLVLQIRIINMRIRPSQIVVDLSKSDLKQCQYIFTTQMGRVSAFTNVVEHHSLPKQLQVSASQQSASMSEASQNKQIYSSHNNLKKQSTSKQLKTNDEQQQPKPPIYSNLVHFQA